MKYLSDVIDFNKQIVLAIAGERTGKTQACIDKIKKTAIENPKAKIAYYVSMEKLVSKTEQELNEQLYDFPSITLSVYSVCEFINQIFIPASPKSKVFDLIIFDDTDFLFHMNPSLGKLNRVMKQFSPSLFMMCTPTVYGFSSLIFKGLWYDLKPLEKSHSIQLINFRTPEDLIEKRFKKESKQSVDVSCRLKTISFSAEALEEYKNNSSKRDLGFFKKEQETEVKQ